MDLQKVKVVWAPVDPAYNTPGMTAQFTGGSSSVRTEWVRLRQAGAAAREMLLAAAADTWGVDRAALRAENGAVIGPGGKRLTYGQLVDKAARIPVPQDVPLKEPSQWRLIGKPTKRLDSREKVTGTATFGLDVRVPGMLTALMARPPVFGGKVRSMDASRARAVRGVAAVVALPSGVAVIGRSFWAAMKGRDALTVTWDEAAGAAVDTAAMRAEYAELAKTPGRPATRKGDVEAALAGAAQTLTADYDMPYLAHAPMEPLNCLVKLSSGRCEIWTGTQNQSVDREHAAKAAGLTPEQVFIHTLCLGGGFGRRANPASVGGRGGRSAPAPGPHLPGSRRRLPAGALSEPIRVHHAHHPRAVRGRRPLEPGAAMTRAARPTRCVGGRLRGGQSLGGQPWMLGSMS